MNKTDMVLLGLAGAAIVAIILYRDTNILSGVPVLNSQPSTDDGNGPAWLVYNQPWGYNAALGGVNFAVSPSRSTGQLGQVGDFGAQQSFTDCGCNG